MKFMTRPVVCEPYEIYVRQPTLRKLRTMDCVIIADMSKRERKKDNSVYITRKNMYTD